MYFCHTVYNVIYTRKLKLYATYTSSCTILTCMPLRYEQPKVAVTEIFENLLHSVLIDINGVKREKTRNVKMSILDVHIIYYPIFRFNKKTKSILLIDLVIHPNDVSRVRIKNCI